MLDQAELPPTSFFSLSDIVLLSAGVAPDGASAGAARPAETFQRESGHTHTHTNTLTCSHKENKSLFSRGFDDLCIDATVLQSSASLCSCLSFMRKNTIGDWEFLPFFSQNKFKAGIGAFYEGMDGATLRCLTSFQEGRGRSRLVKQLR